MIGQSRCVMRRERVAVLGGKGLFEDSVVAALAAKPGLLVRRFSLSDVGATSGEINTFAPDMVVLVGDIDQAVPPNVIPHIDNGMAVLTLDPVEPAMGFSYRVRKSPASLDSVLRTMRAARIMLGTKKAVEKAHTV